MPGYIGPCSLNLINIVSRRSSDRAKQPRPFIHCKFHERISVGNYDYIDLSGYKKKKHALSIEIYYKSTTVLRLVFSHVKSTFRAEADKNSS